MFVYFDRSRPRILTDNIYRERAMHSLSHLVSGREGRGGERDIERERGRGQESERQRKGEKGEARSR